jgi:hypothetical protein
MGHAGMVESWLSKLRGRYPKVRAIAWTVFVIQAVATAIQWGGHMIDAYGHAQFYFDNRQNIAHAFQAIIAAFFSPTGSILTMILCGAFLFLDNRARKHQPIPMPQDSVVRLPRVTAPISRQEIEPSIEQQTINWGPDFLAHDGVPAPK